MSNHSTLNKSSLYIDRGDHQLHLKRFYKKENGTPCFLLHGSIENSKIFYSKSGKGLATFLADHGYDVFIADLRGRGKSRPLIDASHTHDQRDAIISQLPAFINKIKEIKGNQPIHAMAHSWGGVLLYSYLARFDEPLIQSLTFFATKRRIDVININRLLRIDLLWDFMGSLLVKRCGYLPAKEYKFGSDNEPAPFYKQVKKWALRGDWVDPVDGFDYGEVVKNKPLPPALHMTGSKDTHMGHPKDVKRLMQEVGPNPQDEFILLSRDNGFSEDYDHINILTHPNARKDHFPLVVKWLERNC